MRGMLWVVSLLIAGAMCVTAESAWTDQSAWSKQHLVLHLSDGTRTLVRESNKEALFGGYPKSSEIVEFSGITWTLVFTDAGTGLGFDHPALGTSRKNVLKRALAYISEVLNEPGGACEINITSFNANVNLLATAGPLVTGFFGGAINNGSPFQHITTGIDPSPGSPDMQVNVNFFHNYNLSTNPPAANQTDLESVLVHEITHGLGFLKSIAFLEAPAQDCHSGVAEDAGRVEGRGWFNQQPDNYATFDTLLRTGNNNPFINASFFFVGAENFFTGGDNGVFFAGPQTAAVFGSTPAIFAPPGFQCGSSLSHWNFGVDAVMVPGIADGTARRKYADFEVAALRDLGYVNATVGGGGEGEGEGDGEVPGICSLVQVAFTNLPASVQANVNTGTAPIALRSAVTIDLGGGCTEGTLRVTYRLNGVNVGNSTNVAAGFPVNVNRAPGTYLVRAEARFLESAQVISVEQNLTVTAPAVPPMLTVEPTSANFGAVEVNSTSQRSFTVTNTGGGNIQGSASLGAGPYAIQGSATYNLNAGQSQVITVRFAPVDTGTFNATLTFTGPANVQVALTGSGVKTGAFNCGASAPGAASPLGDVAVLLFMVLGFLIALKTQKRMERP